MQIYGQQAQSAESPCEPDQLSPPQPPLPACADAEALALDPDPPHCSSERDPGSVTARDGVTAAVRLLLLLGCDWLGAAVTSDVDRAGVSLEAVCALCLVRLACQAFNMAASTGLPTIPPAAALAEVGVRSLRWADGTVLLLLGS
jgi:hypothetical protein